MDYGSLKMRNVLDHVSVFAHFFLPWVRVTVDDVITVYLDRKSKVSGAWVLRTNTKRHQPVLFRLSYYLQAQFF